MGVKIISKTQWSKINQRHQLLKEFKKMKTIV